MNIKSDQGIEREEVLKCSNCGHKGNSYLSNLSDQTFGDSTGWGMLKCSNANCGLIWLSPRPTPETIDKVYEEYYTHVDQPTSDGVLFNAEQSYYAGKYGYNLPRSWAEIIVWLNPFLKSKLDFDILYLKAFPQGKLLDYGCGNGRMMAKLEGLGWDCYGVDFDSKAVDFCRSKGLKVGLIENWLSDYPDNYFDVITMNQVVEHVFDYKEILRGFYKKLKHNGKLIVATPNMDGRLTTIYGRHLRSLEPPRHLHLFNFKNLKGIIEEEGFFNEVTMSSARVDAWVSITSQRIREKGQFLIGKDTKTKKELFIGLFQQLLTHIKLIFNKKAGMELILISKKIGRE